MDHVAASAALAVVPAQSAPVQWVPPVVDDDLLPDMGRMTLEMTLGRKNSLFAGSDGGTRRWAVIASLIETAKLNGVEPYAWLCDVLSKMVDGHPQQRLDELLPWKRA